jgi:hypothetical protein
MSIDSSVVPSTSINPYDGKLLCVQPYIRERATIDEYGNVQITPNCSGVSWDGVFDSHQTYPGLVYDGSYPPTYNVKGGILYVQDYGGEILYASDVQVNDVEITKDISTEPDDLKNTKANIRKIKPDINSKLKRV